MVTASRGVLPNDADISCCFQETSRGIIKCSAARVSEMGDTDRVTPEICYDCEAGKIYREVGCDQFTPDITVFSIQTHDSVGYEAISNVSGLNCGEKLRQTTLDGCRSCDLASVGKAIECPLGKNSQAVTAGNTTGEKSLMNESLIRQVYPDYEERKAVFLVFRQDNPIVPIVKNFLIELGLQPFELSDMGPFLEEGKHDTNYNCLEAGFKNCHGYIILLTPDDEAKKREGWDSSSAEERREYHYQPRPNVLLEIGMAFTFYGQGTVLLKIVSTPDEDKRFIPLPTDMDGMRYIPLGVKGKIKGVDNTDGLKRIAEKLLRAKCDLQKPNEDLLKRVAKELEGVIDLKEKRFTARNNPANWQGAEWRFIDTKAGVLQSLSFKVESNSNRWRAGFMIGTSHPETNQPLPVHGGSLLFHVGRTSGKYGITVWKGESLTHDDPLPLMKDGSISLSFVLHDDGHIICEANGQVYGFENIDSPWLNRVALLAWADGPDFIVAFRDIETNPQYGLLDMLVVP